MSENRTNSTALQLRSQLIAENKRQKVSRRAHEVPSQVMPALRKEIVGSVRAGRSIKQCASEYNVTQPTVIELWARAMFYVLDMRLQDIEDRMRAAA
jgi:hypothetical protein